MLIYGPVFYLWRNRTYCSLIFSEPFPKKIEFVCAGIDLLKKTQPISLKSNGARSVSAVEIVPGALQYIVDMDALLRLKKASFVVNKFCLYNFIADGKPLLEQQLISRGRTNGRIHRIQRYAHENGLVGPSSVLALEKNLKTWFFASCNELSEYKSAVPKLKKKIREYIGKAVSNNKQYAPALALMGDQIYADADWKPRLTYRSISREFLKKEFPKLDTLSPSISAGKGPKGRPYSGADGPLSSSQIHPLEYFFYFLLFYGHARKSISSRTSSSRKVISHVESVSLAETLRSVPVLMQWDDHDVIDDWNLTRKWEKNRKNKRYVFNTLPFLIMFQAPYLLKDNKKLVDLIKRQTELVLLEKRQNTSKILKVSDAVTELIKYSVRYNYYGNTLAIENRINRKFKATEKRDGYELVVSRDQLLKKHNKGYFIKYKELPDYFDSLSTFKDVIESLSKDKQFNSRNNKQVGFDNIITAGPLVADAAAEYVQKRLIRRYVLNSYLDIDGDAISSGSAFSERVLRNVMKWISSKLDPEPWGLYESDLPYLLSLLKAKRLINSKTLLVGGDVHYAFRKDVNFLSNGITSTIRVAAISPLALMQNAQPFHGLEKLKSLFDVSQNQIMAEEERYYYSRSISGAGFRTSSNTLTIGVYPDEIVSRRKFESWISKEKILEYLKERPKTLDDDVTKIYNKMGRRLKNARDNKEWYLIIVKAHHKAGALIEQQDICREQAEFLTSKGVRQDSIYTNNSEDNKTQNNFGLRLSRDKPIRIE
ncbi:MAG: hypothetical protein ABW077_19215 [Candidatus Thiodiazotropha endolucinida]